MKAPGVRLWTPLVVWLSACAVGPNFVRPRSEPSPSWGRLDEPGITAGETVETAWWDGFGDPILTELVRLAAHANHDVRIAEARVREARGLRGVVRADLFPTITADGDYQREQRSKNQPFLGSLPIPRGPEDLFEAGFDATWEVDLWGRVRRSVEAADADQHAAEAERRDVLITIIGELAREYVEFRGFQRQIEVTEKNVAIQRGLFELTRDLARAGLSTDVEVARAEAQVDATDSTLPTLRAEAKARIHRLSVLTGQPPLALDARLEPIAQVPTPPSRVVVGAPADALRHRADVRAAEDALAAATARIGVAVADLFPKVVLSGNLTLQSDSFGHLFDGDSAAFGVGPRVRWPLLDFGRIRSNITVQDARQAAALTSYEQTVLRALEEAETALVRYGEGQRNRDLVARSFAASDTAVRLAQDRYEHGLESFLTVLDAERDLFARESELVRSQTTVTTNAIALYKALGGGWEPFEPTAPASQDTATLVDAIPVLGTVRELGRQMRRTRAE